MAIGNHKTVAYEDGDDTIVRYHNTNVVTFNSDRIILNTGGYWTVTTKRRMNQTSEHFGLGFTVYQHNWHWSVEHNGNAYGLGCVPGHGTPSRTAIVLDRHCR